MFLFQDQVAPQGAVKYKTPSFVFIYVFTLSTKAILFSPSREMTNVAQNSFSYQFTKCPSDEKIISFCIICLSIHKFRITLYLVFLSRYHQAVERIS